MVTLLAPGHRIGETLVVGRERTCVAEGAGRSLEDFETVLKATRSWTSAPRRAATTQTLRAPR